MPTGVIDTAPLFGSLHAELIAILRSLAAEDWMRPTIAGRWRVRDVAACTIRLSADAVWRLLFNALPPARARAELRISGDRTLAEPLLGARSVIV